MLSRVISRKITNLTDNTETLETYTYDANGNNLSSAVSTESDTFVYDDNNRLIEYNGQAVTYDADGNMLSANSLALTYDSANRLISAGNNSYTYDIENTRIKNLCNGVETVYTYNTNANLSQLLVKTTGDTVTKYVYGVGLIGEETAGSFKTYHFDYRGSTVAITDINGNVTDTFTYDSYGNLVSRTGTTETIFLYNGEHGVITDSNGLLYMRARYYSPELRRFVNADVLLGDINNSLTLNRYAYANGNPVSNVDPFGLSADSGRGNNDLFDSIKNFSLGFLDTGKKGLQTVFEIICGFEFQAGYGTGLRGALDFAGETATLGAKVDLLTIKIGSDYFDIGQEALSGATWDLSFAEGVGVGKEEGYFESYITGEIEQYDSKYPEVSFDVFGVDIYVLIGFHAEVSYDFQKVFNKIINIWS